MDCPQGERALCKTCDNRIHFGKKKSHFRAFLKTALKQAEASTNSGFLPQGLLTPRSRAAEEAAAFRAIREAEVREISKAQALRAAQDRAAREVERVAQFGPAEGKQRAKSSTSKSTKRTDSKAKWNPVVPSSTNFWASQRETAPKAPNTDTSTKAPLTDTANLISQSPFTKATILAPMLVEKEPNPLRLEQETKVIHSQIVVLNSINCLN